jgi:hypothetical protein
MSATGGVGDVGIVSLVGFGSSVGIVDIGMALGGNSVSFAGWQLDNSNILMENVITVRPKVTAIAHVLRGVTVLGSTP